MKLQTKCTWVIVGLFIVEILPVPVTSLYSLYAIRKRPSWLPMVTHRLYAEATHPHNTIEAYTNLPMADPMKVRKNCTLALSLMFAVDLLVPVVIPTALYVVRRRPKWFKELVIRLYADHPALLPSPTHVKTEEQPHHFEIAARAEQKLAALERKNFHFAKSHSQKRRRWNNTFQ